MLLSYFAVFLVLTPVLASGRSGWTPPAPLEAQLAAWVDSVAPGSRLGIAVRSVRSGELLHAKSAQDWFTPASTLKILVTATALDELPPDYSPSTDLRLEGRMRGRTFLGSVKVVGKGDPNISARYYENALAVPLQMADSLRARGIDTIRGLLLADSSWFSGPRRPKTWRPNYFDAWYGAEISALSFNDNCYRLEVVPGARPGDSAQIRIDPDVGYVEVSNQLTTVIGRRRNVSYDLDPHRPVVRLTGRLGGQSAPFSLVLPVRDPAAYFLAALRKAFEVRGIAFIPDPEQEPGKIQAPITFTTAPLLSVLDEINQRSQNLHAEMLLRNLGALRYGDGSDQRGLQAGRAFLQRLGMDPQDIHAVDGSGLSPASRVKPAAMSQLLARMARHPRGDLYIASLGHPGISGASAKRLADLSVAHRVRVKTGFINGVQGLVGYVFTSYGDTLAVALHLNGYKVSDQVARDLMDTLWSRISLAHNAEFAAQVEARRLWRLAQAPANYRDRVRFFSGALLGKPYQLGSTGEGITGTVEIGPLMNMQQFDCVTYMEHVMALAAAPKADSVLPILQQIRYYKGQIDFRTRKHYFVEDWIGGNPAWVRPAALPGDTTIHRHMNKQGFFAAKQIPYRQPPKATAIRYLPYEKALQWARQQQGKETLLGVAFLANRDDLCVTHTGFFIAQPGKPPILRHASSLARRVVDQDFGEYLQSRRGKTPGVFFFELLDPTL